MRRAAAAVLLLAPLLAWSAPQMPGRAHAGATTAPSGVALQVAEPGAVLRWTEPLAKVAEAEDSRRYRVGLVRSAPKDFALPAWHAVPGGHVLRFDVESPGALGLRVRVDLVPGQGALELRARGADGPVETMTIGAGAAEAWGPWTAGERQSVEVFARMHPGEGAVRAGAIVHFDRPLEAKAAASCTVDTLCSTGDAALDAAIAERKKSLARILFVDGGKSFVCSGTLLNSEKYPAPYFLTANHCIGRADVAASVTTLWFHEATACGSGRASPSSRQVAGGMQVVFADPNTDQTLLLMNAPPPEDAVFSGWDARNLAAGDAATSLSHPEGDVSKLALARVERYGRFPDFETRVWLTRFSRGIVQGGSSGSGLFTLGGAGLQLRGVLYGVTVGAGGALSCSNTDEYGAYSRFDVFYPQVARYLMANPAPVADDHGNRPAEATPVTLGGGETTVAGRIDYPGDVDVYRIEIVSDGTLVASGGGGGDTVGVLLDANGERITSNDDAQSGAVDFGITRRLAPGTYYLAVSHWESADVASYSVRFSFLPVTENYTDLWWDPAESGWGINVNHQGEKVFATLFTYDAGGAPLWLVLSDGARQPDGSFEGALYRTRGPSYRSPTWSPIALTVVGRMRLAFDEAGGRLAYSVNGVEVVKRIERLRYSDKAPACSWSAFDRSYATNFQDLWWNPAESGWGLNLSHQGDILFATLFTYADDGAGLWLVMSSGQREPGSAARYGGTLYRTTGPAFNAQPWSPVTNLAVGTMSVEFADGNRGTLTYTVEGTRVTKQIERLVFSYPATMCESPDE